MAKRKFSIKKTREGRILNNKQSKASPENPNEKTQISMKSDAEPINPSENMVKRKCNIKNWPGKGTRILNNKVSPKISQRNNLK